MQKLNDFRVSSFEHDWVRWLGSSDGSFTVRSLRTLIRGPIPPNCFWQNFVWRGSAPPKVELFLWFVVLNRVSVLVELIKRGLSTIPSNLCPFCQRYPETVEHLFLTCWFSWKIWMFFCLDMRISASWPSNPTLFLEAWADLGFPRNDIVFNDMSMDWINLKFLIKF
ncbi:hypothetical protein GQ457_04G010920 [Hibiscus cannabinus]